MIRMAKPMNKGAHKRKGKSHYLVLIGALIFLIGWYLILFPRHEYWGIGLLLFGIFVCAVGLSKHSFRLLLKGSYDWLSGS
jgi:uncharacterized membrane protein HdeD (DUF308 family)